MPASARIRRSMAGRAKASRREAAVAGGTQVGRRLWGSANYISVGSVDVYKAVRQRPHQLVFPGSDRAVPITVRGVGSALKEVG